VAALICICSFRVLLFCNFNQYVSYLSAGSDEELVWTAGLDDDDVSGTYSAFNTPFDAVPWVSPNAMDFGSTASPPTCSTASPVCTTMMSVFLS
jgi:hypothetical protein